VELRDRLNELTNPRQKLNENLLLIILSKSMARSEWIRLFEALSNLKSPALRLDLRAGLEIDLFIWDLAAAKTMLKRHHRYLCQTT
jgi:hypothetical protein